jgi:hypothetical protein
MTGGVRIMRRITQATAVGILLPLMACSKVDLSGTYLASDPNMAMMLQLEEAPDNPHQRPAVVLDARLRRPASKAQLPP